MKIIPKKLIMKNFKSKANVSLEFDDNINILTGDNGQGKTTVVEALTILLYNYYDDKLSSYIMRGEDTFFISLEALLNDESLDISMSYDGKNTTKIVTYQNEEVHNSEANKLLDELLNHKLSVVGTIVSSDTKNVLNLKPAEVREHLKDIYSLKFNAKADEYDKTAKSLEAKDKATIEKEIYRLNNIEYTKPETKELPYSSSQVVEFKNSIKDLTIELSGIALHNEKVKTIENNLRNLETLKDAKELTLKSTNTKYETTLNKIEQLNKDDKVNRLENELGELQTKLDTIKITRVKKYDDTIITELQENRIKLESQISALKKRQSDLSNGTCPTCGQDCDSHFQDNIEDELSTLETELNYVIFHELADEKEKKSEIDKKVEENETNKQSKQLLTQKIESKENEINTALETNSKRESELITESKDYIKAVETLGLELTKLKESVTIEETTLRDVKQVSENDIDEDSINSQISDLEQSIKQYESIVTLNKQAETELENIDKKILQDKKDLEVKLVELDNVQEKINNYRQSRQVLLTQFPNFVISQLAKDLEDRMNLIISENYNSEHKVSVVETRAGITFKYNDLPISRCSGWEKSITKLAMVLSLNEILGSDLLFLDEVDATASENNSHRIYDFLLEYLDKNKKTSFVISHKESVVEKVSNYDAKVFLVKGSEITEI